MRLVGTLPHEQSDEWQMMRRSTRDETIIEVIGSEGQTILTQLGEATRAGDPGHPQPSD